MANTQLTEEERQRLAMMQARRDAARWSKTAGLGAQYPYQYTGAPDPGLIQVGPIEALIGGPALAGARVGARVAPALWSLRKTPGVQKAIAATKNFFVRPGYGGKGARPTFTRVPGGGRGKWKRPDTWKRNPDPPAYNPRLGPGSYLAMGAGGAAAALMDGDETPTTEVGLLEAAGAPVATNAATPTDTTTADAGGLLADASLPPQLQGQRGVDPNYVAAGEWTPAGDAEEALVAVAAGDVAAEEAVVEPDPNASTVDKLDVSQIAPAKQQELERVWGKYTYSPKERHNKFMEQLNSIYMKAAWLDVIASITGGTSQSAQYISRATSKLEMMAKFDQEERVYNIWRDVYHDENGTYDPPKSKKEAAERARRLGASPEETQKIYGWGEDQDDLVSWWRPADNEKKYEVKTTHGKKERPAPGTGADWIMGSPPDSLTDPKTTVPKYVWAVPPGGGPAVRMTEEEARQSGSTKQQTNLGDELIWAVPPGEVVATLVTKSTAMQGGYTKQQTGGLLQDYAAETQQLVSSGDPDAWSKGVAKWEIYFAGAQKDPITQRISMMQPDQLRQAAEQQMRRIYASLDKTPPGAVGGDNPIVSGQPKTKEEAYIMARGDPQNSELSDEEVKADVEAYWSKRMGQSQ